MTREQGSIGHGERFPTEWTLDWEEQPEQGRSRQEEKDVRPESAAQEVEAGPDKWA